MKRTSLLIGLLLFACAIAGAQVTSVRIGTNFLAPGNSALSGSNPAYIVDGTVYTSPQNFTWPVGSKHIVEFLLSVDANGNVLGYQSTLSDSIRYGFAGWVTNGAVTLGPLSSAVQTVSADPSLTSLIAQVTATYRVHINFPSSVVNPASGGSCGGAPGNPGANQQGVVCFAGNAYFGSTDGLSDPFVVAGTYPLNAFPFPGWVFYGWSIGNNPPDYLTSITITRPTNILAMFSVAKRVNFVTVPQGLDIIVDGAVVHTGTSSDGVTCTNYQLPPGAPTGFTPLCAGQFDFLPGS